MAEPENVDPGTTNDQDQDPTSAGTQNTDTKGPVPYERFHEVNSKWKADREEKEALAAERDQLRAELDKSKRAPARSATEALPSPPAGLSERENARWLIENDTRAYLEREFGMGLDDLRAVISSVPEVSRTAHLSQWERLCAKHGLDPEDQTTRDAFRGLGLAEQSDGKKPDPEKVMQRVVGILGKSKKPLPSPSEVERSGLSRTVTVENFMPRDAKEANDAAQKGRRAPDFSTTDILKARTQQRAKG